jgi:hypothetical protein
MRELRRGDPARRPKACPECGADERTGWRETEDSIYDGLDLPSEAFEDEASRRTRPVRRINGVVWFWWATGVALLVGLLLAFSGVL